MRGFKRPRKGRSRIRRAGSKIRRPGPEETTHPRSRLRVGKLKYGVRIVLIEDASRLARQLVTQELAIPTIGIGAGPDCDGQVLVFHDLLGLSFGPPAKFVRRYADVGSIISRAVDAYKEDVKAGAYPSDGESYHLPKETLSALERIAERKRAMPV